ncbi:MAG: glutathionylspermidine synthase family protein [Psychrobacter sp.]|nr:glutathionylspermidine synthase family protein [Psychrobacter sp.]
MIRRAVTPRPNWQSKLERLGFDYHSLEGSYWQESACYEFTAAQIDIIEEATTTLHQMCLSAVDFIITNDRFAQLGISDSAAALIEQSWQRRDPCVYGRFDLVYHPIHTPTPKLLEYNADTPTSLFEASVAQWYWLQDNFPQADQFNSIHERLIGQWRIIDETLSRRVSSSSNYQARPVSLVKPVKASSPTKITFATITDSIEDVVTCRYLQDTAIQAGLETQFMDLRKIGVMEEDGKVAQFVDLADSPIGALFKLYPWEWLIQEAFSAYLADSHTQWLEPMWKSLLSNKGILPILWELNPNHPNLLPSYFAAERTKLTQLTPTQIAHGIIQKPLFSREGANITLLNTDFSPTGLMTSGEYGNVSSTQMVYQAMQPLPQFMNHANRPVYPVIGSWVIGHSAAGIGIREDDSLITKDTSHFVPHYFVP